MSETPAIYISGNVIFFNRSGSHNTTYSPPPEYLFKNKKSHCNIIYLPNTGKPVKNIRDQIESDEKSGQ